MFDKRTLYLIVSPPPKNISLESKYYGRRRQHQIFFHFQPFSLFTPSARVTLFLFIERTKINIRSIYMRVNYQFYNITFFYTSTVLRFITLIQNSFSSSLYMLYKINPSPLMRIKNINNPETSGGLVRFC